MDSLFASLTIIASLLGMSATGGLIFAAFILPKRETMNFIFAGFCFFLWVWMAMSLLQIVPQFQSDTSGQFTRNLQVTAMTCAAAMFLAFVVYFTTSHDQVNKTLIGLLSISLVIVLIMIWTGQVFTVSSDSLDTIQLSPIGLLTIGITIVYVLFSFWIILNSDTPEARLLRVPALLLLGALAISHVYILRTIPVDMILGTIAAVWVGWIVLHRQLFSPLPNLNQELLTTNQELQTANQDLQRAVNDLAKEKSVTERLNRDLTEANRYKDDFLANMSHELRTPLNSIIGYSELLLSNIYGELTEKQQDRLQRIYQNGTHLSELISAILDLSKIESGKMRLDVSRFQLTDILTKIMADIETQCVTKGLKLETTVAPRLPALSGDMGRISQVLGTLLENAVKFTTEGSITVTADDVAIKKGQSDQFVLPTIGWLQDGEWIMVRVKDTGIGIAPEDQARIFDQFSQADGSRTREHEGIGLGLTIAKRLVEMHDGALWVNSKVGEGSTFFVALPADTTVQTVDPV